MNLGRIKEVIVLYGFSDSGKTGILTELCKNYRVLFGAQNYHEICHYMNNRDKLVRVLLPDGRTLGIGTAGDNADTVLDSFMSFHDQGVANPTFKNSGCDIVILAVRTLTTSRRIMTSYSPRKSLAEIELEEIISMYGANWKLSVPPGKAQLRTSKIAKGTPNFARLCRNDAVTVLKDIRSLVGY